MSLAPGSTRRSRGRNELDAIVVGAGAAGGALALALARDGLEVAVVEAREPTPWRPDDDVDLRVVALAPDARVQVTEADFGWTFTPSGEVHARLRCVSCSSNAELSACAVTLAR